MPWIINNWDQNFETSESRKVKFKLTWVAIPAPFDSLILKRIMKMDNCMEIIGVWEFLVRLASQMPERGTFIKDGVDLDFDDFEDLTGCPGELFKKIIPILSSSKIGYLTFLKRRNEGSSENDSKTSGASPGKSGETADTPGESAGKSGETAGEIDNSLDNNNLEKNKEKYAGTPGEDAGTPGLQDNTTQNKTEKNNTVQDKTGQDLTGQDLPQNLDPLFDRNKRPGPNYSFDEKYGWLGDLNSGSTPASARSESFSETRPNPPNSKIEEYDPSSQTYKDATTPKTEEQKAEALKKEEEERNHEKLGIGQNLISDDILEESKKQREKDKLIWKKRMEKEIKAEKTQLEKDLKNGVKPKKGAKKGAKKADNSLSPEALAHIISNGDPTKSKADVSTSEKKNSISQEEYEKRIKKHKNQGPSTEDIAKAEAGLREKLTEETKTKSKGVVSSLISIELKGNEIIKDIPFPELTATQRAEARIKARKNIKKDSDDGSREVQ